MAIKNTNQTKTGVGYIRESTEEQDKRFSPENQKQNIEKYAKDHNIKIIRFYDEGYDIHEEIRKEFLKL